MSSDRYSTVLSEVRRLCKGSSRGRQKDDDKIGLDQHKLSSAAVPLPRNRGRDGDRSARGVSLHAAGQSETRLWDLGCRDEQLLHERSIHVLRVAGGVLEAGNGCSVRRRRVHEAHRRGSRFMNLLAVYIATIRQSRDVAAIISFGSCSKANPSSPECRSPVAPAGASRCKRSLCRQPHSPPAYWLQSTRAWGPRARTAVIIKLTPF